MKWSRGAGAALLFLALLIFFVVSGCSCRRRSPASRTLGPIAIISAKLAPDRRALAGRCLVSCWSSSSAPCSC